MGSREMSRSDAVHKHPKVRQWLARHPRWAFHFTPTSASWLNAVEGFFAKLTKRRLKRGVFRSIVVLQDAINRFIAETNASPKPFYGPPIPNASSPLSAEGSKRWGQSTGVCCARMNPGHAGEIASTRCASTALALARRH